MTVSPTRGEGNLTGLQRHLLSYPHQPKVEDVRFHCFWPADSSHGVHGHGEGGKANCPVQLCKDPPVP